MLTTCPICNGEIQATREADLSGVRLSDDALDVVSDGSETGYGDMRVYCQNDHDQDEMIAHMVNAQASAKDDARQAEHDHIDAHGDTYGPAQCLKCATEIAQATRGQVHPVMQAVLDTIIPPATDDDPRCRSCGDELNDHGECSVCIDRARRTPLGEEGTTR